MRRTTKLIIFIVTTLIILINCPQKVRAAESEYLDSGLLTLYGNQNDDWLKFSYVNSIDDKTMTLYYSASNTWNQPTDAVNSTTIYCPENPIIWTPQVYPNGASNDIEFRSHQGGASGYQQYDSDIWTKVTFKISNPILTGSPYTSVLQEGDYRWCDSTNTYHYFSINIMKSELKCQSEEVAQYIYDENDALQNYINDDGNISSIFTESAPIYHTTAAFSLNVNNGWHYDIYFTKTIFNISTKQKETIVTKLYSDCSGNKTFDVTIEDSTFAYCSIEIKTNESQALVPVYNGLEKEYNFYLETVTPSIHFEDLEGTKISETRINKTNESFYLCIDPGTYINKYHVSAIKLINNTTSSEESFPEDTQKILIESSGEYSLSLSIKENSLVYNFGNWNIAKIPPKIQNVYTIENENKNYLSSYENSYYTNTSQEEVYVELVKTSSLSNVFYYSLTNDNGVYNWIEIQNFTFSILTNEQVYEIYLKDEFENISIIKIVVDRTNPDISFYTKENNLLPNNSSTNSLFFFFDWNTTEEYSVSYSLNGNNIGKVEKNFHFTETGVYSFGVSDLAGNISYYTIICDRDEIPIAIYDSSANKYDENSKYYYSSLGFEISFNEFFVAIPNDAALLIIDGSEKSGYISSDEYYEEPIKGEGRHTVFIKDFAGNEISYYVYVSTQQFLTNYVSMSEKFNSYLTVFYGTKKQYTWDSQKKHLFYANTGAGSVVYFQTYKDAFQYAANREFSIVEHFKLNKQTQLASCTANNIASYSSLYKNEAANIIITSNLLSIYNNSNEYFEFYLYKNRIYTNYLSLWESIIDEIENVANPCCVQEINYSGGLNTYVKYQYQGNLSYFNDNNYLSTFAGLYVEDFDLNLSAISTYQNENYNYSEGDYNLYSCAPINPQDIVLEYEGKKIIYITDNLTNNAITDMYNFPVKLEMKSNGVYETFFWNDILYNSELTFGTNLMLIRETTVSGISIEYFICVDYDAPKIFLNPNLSIVPNTTVNLDAANNDIKISANVKLSTTNEKELTTVTLVVVYQGKTFYLNVDDCNKNYLTISADETRTTIIDQTVFSSGKYLISVYDKAGNCNSYTFFVSTKLLATSMIDIVDEEITEGDNVIGFECTIKTLEDINEIKEISIIHTFVDGDTGTEISENISPATFSTSLYTFQSAGKEGKFDFIFQDAFGRNYSFIKKINSRSPIGYVKQNIDGSLKEVIPKSDFTFYINTSVIFTWNETYNYTATIKNIDSDVTKDYPNSQKISIEGNYLLILKSPTNKKTEYTIVIDTTKPTGSFYLAEPSDIEEAKNLGILEKDYIGNLTVAGLLGKLNVPGSKFGMCFIPDEEIKDSNFTNVYVEYTFGSTTTKYNSSTEFTILNGVYSFYIEDIAGNYNNYTITYDNTPVDLSLKNVSATKSFSDGDITNENIKLTWSEPVRIQIYYESFEGEKNNYQKSSPYTITIAGKYTILTSDQFYNEKTYNLIFDDIKPVLSFYDDEDNLLMNNSSTSSDVRISWSEENIMVLLNKSSYVENGTQYNKTNTYSFLAEDIAGNTNLYTITIIKEASSGYFTNEKNEIINVSENPIINYSVIFYWKDPTAIATLNGKSITSGKKINYEGSHEIVITNSVGLTSVYTFSIDLTDPLGHFYYIDALTKEKIKITSSKTKEDVYFESDLQEDSFIVVNGKRATDDTFPLTDEESYEVLIFDVANNFTKYSIAIDHTPAKINLSTSQQGGFREGHLTNGYVIISWNEENCSVYMNEIAIQNNKKVMYDGKYSIKIFDDCNNVGIEFFEIDTTKPTGYFYLAEDEECTPLTNYTVKDAIYFEISSDEKAFTLTVDGMQWYNFVPINAEGEHQIELTDIAGNTNLYTITIDNQPAEIVLTTSQEGGFKSNYMTNGIVKASWDEENCSAYLDGEKYNKNTPIEINGRHVIGLYDFAKNYQEISFIIHTVVPSGDLQGVNEKNYSNGTVTFTWNRENSMIDKVVLNDVIEYTEDIVVSDPKEYSITIYDIFGNKNFYSFIIDKTVPSGELKNSDGEIINETKINYPVSYNWYNETYEATLNGKNYLPGTLIRYDGEYTITLTSLAGKSQTFSFEIKTVLPKNCFECYEKIGEESNLIANPDDSQNSLFFILKDVSATITKDNQTKEYISETVIEETGEYQLRLFDDFGNEKFIYFTVSEPIQKNYYKSVISSVVVILLSMSLIAFIIKKKITNQNSNVLTKKK